MLFKDFSGEATEKGGYIIAYASTFDREPDLQGDIIAKGAFDDSLAEWKSSGKPIPLIFNHQFDDPEFNIGHVVEAKQDDRGLLIKAVFDPDNDKAQYVRKLIQEGRMWKMSFGSIVQEARFVELEDERRCREIVKSQILEVSIVQIPANEHAEILVVKSGEDANADTSQIAATEATTEEVTQKGILSGLLSVSDAMAILSKSLAGLTQTLTLRLTDAQGNVVSEIPLTAEFVAGEISHSDQPAGTPDEHSEEIPDNTKEGDPSPSEASEDGGKGAPDADAEFLAEYYQTIEQGD